MFRYFDIFILRISLSFGSIVTTHTQIYSGPTLIMVSCIIYSETLFFFDDSFSVCTFVSSVRRIHDFFLPFLRKIKLYQYF